jgi:hypothetical protein
MNAEHFHADIVVPSGAFSLQAQACLERIGRIDSDQIKHDLSQQR